MAYLEMLVQGCKGTRCGGQVPQEGSGGRGRSRTVGFAQRLHHLGRQHGRGRVLRCEEVGYKDLPADHMRRMSVLFDSVSPGIAEQHVNFKQLQYVRCI